MVQSSVPIERPDPPVVGKVTHHTIELIWMHLKEKLPTNQKFKFVVQEADKKKKEWGQVYAGYGYTKTVESLEPFTEYSYRLCVIGTNNERSEYSPVCTVKTTKEPLNGEALHKAIILDRKSDVERILDSVDGPRVVEIPDKFG
ncbi:Fibronectin type 3 and ankyrin repeat domains 1, partial [Brachionus plicatilis]